MTVIEKVKKKREFSKLPDSIVSKAVEISKEDIKEARAFLRKYFGVFLTNKVLKGKGNFKEILKSHISSKKRNYKEFYKKIFEKIGFVNSIIDLGAGVNGLSINKLYNISGATNYYGIEATGQIVDIVNKYFDENCKDFDAYMIHLDLFDLNEVMKVIKKAKGIRVVFMFQLIDALESLEKNFSKKLILKFTENSKYLVITLPTESLGGRKKFMVNRKWLIEFLEEHFEILDDFEANGERILCLQNN